MLNTFTTTSFFLFTLSIVSTSGFLARFPKSIHPQKCFSQSSLSLVSDRFPSFVDLNTDAKEDKTRREIIASLLLAGSVATVGSFPAPSFATSTSPESATTTPINSIDEALKVISSSCDRRYLHAVIASDYRCLYRGAAKQDATIPSIHLSEPSDLLLPETYGSKNAADYFAALDEQMEKGPIRPSNGHLAVTSIDKAKVWGGDAVSIWPLGGEKSDVHFAWLEEGGEFWPSSSTSSRSTVSSEKDLPINRKVVVDGIDCGRMGLEDALEGDGWEVMFKADRFLSVPVSMEKELLDGLRQSFII